MILITTYYDEKNIERKHELMDCLTRNALNPAISEIHIISENVLPPLDSSDKVKIVLVRMRWTFKDLIKYANNLHKDCIKIIANTDIFFNQTLSYASEIREREVYCLTRWDLIFKDILKFYFNVKSQDVWIFRDILPDSIGDYFMGIPGCDNRLAHELNEKGFKLLNPGLTIQAIHIHNSKLRNYNKSIDKVKGPYYYPFPLSLKKISNNMEKKNYLILRRKYYSALLNGELEGAKFAELELIKFRFLEIYMKLRLRLNG